MNYYPEPPYLLLVLGLLIGAASGTAFDATLKQAVQDWVKNRSTRNIAILKGPQLLIPFLGIAGGVCLFLASGVEVFGFTRPIAYAIALPLTIFTSLLIWSQLSKNLVLLERGGSQALDLDSLG